MPIADINDAHEVDEHLNRILAAGDNAGSATAIRSMFVETLDWDYAHGIASLHGANDDALPRDARLLARREGCIAAYMPLHSRDDPPVTPTNRITAATVNAAARSLSADLGDDLLLLFTNAGGGEFHIIRPGFAGSRLDACSAWSPGAASITAPSFSSSPTCGTTTGAAARPSMRQ